MSIFISRNRKKKQEKIVMTILTHLKIQITSRNVLNPFCSILINIK